MMSVEKLAGIRRCEARRVKNEASGSKVTTCPTKRSLSLCCEVLGGNSEFIDT